MLRLAPLLLVACTEATPLLIDLDGPRGTVTAPGPWPVRIYADGLPASLQVSVNDGEFAAVSLSPGAGGERFGLLPDAPPGTILRYYATAGGRSEPSPERARRVEVHPPRPPTDPAPPATCRLAFRWPTDGLVLTPQDDDAPQAGVQILVVVETNLSDGAPVRLGVQGRGYSGVAGAGVVGFAQVTLPEGALALEAEATPAGGTPCRAAIEVRRVP